MAMELSVVTLSLLLVSSFSPSNSAYPLPVIKPWCSQVPYPDLCEYFFTQNPKHGDIPIRQKSDFLKVSVQLVLERAINATKMAASLGAKCRDPSEMAAWRDCLDLYENTVNILNQTNDPDTEYSSYDAQTWLGTTLTNLETCKQGFTDFGITGNVMPLVIDIVLQNLTINALAFNRESCHQKATSYQNSAFPAWISPMERRLLQSSTWDPSFGANVVVAQDGSGDYTKVNDAIHEASKRVGKERFVIYVKAGVYQELVLIRHINIMLVGDGIGKTIITGKVKASEGHTTYMAATVGVEGKGFIARGITFRNTAGPQGGQAVALRSDSDYSVYYRCSFEGYQDTLFVRTNRQFFRQCNIYGTVDFIFGDATVVFQKCSILARKHDPGRINTITAQSKSSIYTCSGMSFHSCRVRAAPDLKPIEKSVRTYLGRPWRNYSRVVFMESDLGRLIDPAGWLSWDAPVDTVYYGEYNNVGLGASTAGRVKWPGYHVIRSPSEASKFSVRRFIHGKAWLPQIRIPFDLDL